jgi:excisionase family DNA binding protein
MSEPLKPDSLAVTLTVEQLRELMREELKGATANNTHSPTLLSAEEAANRWNVPRTWISEMARQGKLPSVKLGHYVRFRPEDLEEFIRRNRTG